LTESLLNLLSVQIISFATGITNYTQIYCRDFVINIGTWQTREETPAENANVNLFIWKTLSIIHMFYQNKLPRRLNRSLYECQLLNEIRLFVSGRGEFIFLTKM